MGWDKSKIVKKRSKNWYDTVYVYL
jgi:hypothetical protein